MIGAIIQARTSSTRLPGKVLKELPYGSGITVLEQVIRRVKQSKRIDQIIVATTHDENDAAIVEIVKRENILFFKGSVNNVLERYYLAAKENALDHIVRITSDCPCIDPDINDITINEHFDKQADYTTNALIRTYPVGFDVEIFRFNVLEKAYQKARGDYDREHVTPYIQDSPDIFKIAHVKASKELTAPHRRITLDTWEDYVLLCAIFDQLYDQNPNFSALDIAKLFEQKPWLNLINQNITAKKYCETLDDEIKELVHIAKLQNYQKGRKFLEGHLVKHADH